MNNHGLVAQANSKGGSGLISATVRYRGSNAEQHIWGAVARVRGCRIFSDPEFKTSFVTAQDAAQLFADQVYTDGAVDLFLLA